MDVVVSMDEAGRLVIPKNLREAAPSHSFVAEMVKEGILLRPLPALDALFGSLPNLNMKKFAQQHREDTHD